MTHVYFVAAPDAGLVKIGASARPERRLQEMQVGSPERLELVGVIRSGGPMLEADIHKRFEDDRVHGEWFRISESLLDYIDAHTGLASATETELQMLERYAFVLDETLTEIVDRHGVDEAVDLARKVQERFAS